MGAANSGVEVGWSDPVSFSRVTATRAALSIAPRRRCMALPSDEDWNIPAGFGLPPLGISHISYAFPVAAGGRLFAINRTPRDALTNIFPFGWGCPVPNVLTVV